MRALDAVRGPDAAAVRVQDALRVLDAVQAQGETAVRELAAVVSEGQEQDELPVPDAVPARGAAAVLEQDVVLAQGVVQGRVQAWVWSQALAVARGPVLLLAQDAAAVRVQASDVLPALAALQGQSAAEWDGLPAQAVAAAQSAVERDGLPAADALELLPASSVLLAAAAAWAVDDPAVAGLFPAGLLLAVLPVAWDVQ